MLSNKIASALRQGKSYGVPTSILRVRFIGGIGAVLVDNHPVLVLLQDSVYVPQFTQLRDPIKKLIADVSKSIDLPRRITSIAGLRGRYLTAQFIEGLMNE